MIEAITDSADHEVKWEFYIPTFKAGVDCGMVTAVEIGDMKRDIAYHGDTVNTASRIQGLCSFLDKNFLVSKTFHELIIAQEGFFTESIGTYLLKGKRQRWKFTQLLLEADQRAIVCYGKTQKSRPRHSQKER